MKRKSNPIADRLFHLRCRRQKLEMAWNDIRILGLKVAADLVFKELQQTTKEIGKITGVIP